MSVEFDEVERQEALESLRLFTKEHPYSIGADEPLPIRVVQFSLAAEDIEGECIEWALEYLHKSKVPDAVAAIVTNEAVKEVLALDLFEEGSLLETPKLARTLLNKVLDVCNRWSQKECPVFYKSRMTYDVFVHAIKNTRRKMEDRHSIVPHFNALFGLSKDYPSQAFFAVYDGHGGVDASIYASTHLHSHLARHANLQTDRKTALKEAFKKTDEYFVSKAKREGLRSGSTGVAAFISGNSLCVAWLGDSQIILSKGGQLVTLMNPHKPERQDERQRIEDLGGCVVWFGAWRVNGSLSVSRAIGDAEHKPYISGEPDVMEYTLEGDEEFIVLACDGLWDVLSPDKAVDLINKFLKDGGSRSSVATMLVNHAKEEGSNDNISVVFVFLDAHRKEVPVKKASVSDQSVMTEQDGGKCDTGQEQRTDGCKTNANVSLDMDKSQTTERKSSPVFTVSVEDGMTDRHNGVVDAETLPKEPSLAKTAGNQKGSKPIRHGSEKGKKSPKGSPKSRQKISPGHLDVKSRSVRSKSAPEITPIN